MISLYNYKIPLGLIILANLLLYQLIYDKVSGVGWYTLQRPNPQLKLDLTGFYDLALSIVQKLELGARVMTDLVVLLSVLVVLVDIVDNH